MKAEHFSDLYIQENEFNLDGERVEAQTQDDQENVSDK